MQDGVNDVSDVTAMHDVDMLTHLSPTQLQCVLIRFNHTRACLQKLIKSV